MSGLEQVRDLIGIGLRDVIIHADEVMHLFRLRQYIFEKKKYDIKDPQQRAEYIKYIKSDIKNFEQKKQQLNL